MSIVQAPVAHRTLNSRDMMRRVNALRATDNVTNWLYIAREYVYLGTVVGLTITFYNGRVSWGLESWLWDVPITLLAFVLVGAGQHRLTTLSHEGSHYLLFRNRLLNELASDWLTMFPMWSTTHHYRIQHLAHHQFPNDPERDPDVMQMTASGHRFPFPMRPRQFMWECVIKQLLIVPKLIRYIRVRASFNATGGGSGPYDVKGPRSKLLITVGVVYLALTIAVTTTLSYVGDPLWLAVAPGTMLAATLSFYAIVPARYYRQTNLRPDVSPRWMTFGRVTYLTLLFTGLACLTRWSGMPWGLYYFVLWVVPIFTTFSFFMILRQTVQHGNASRDRFTNTRIFLVGSLIRFAVFPLGMDYHLPHHLFPLVPHYRLPRLHRLLLDTEEYRNQATIAEGYFWHRRPPQHATVLELMARAD